MPTETIYDQWNVTYSTPYWKKAEDKNRKKIRQSKEGIILEEALYSKVTVHEGVPDLSKRKLQ